MDDADAWKFFGDLLEKRALEMKDKGALPVAIALMGVAADADMVARMLREAKKKG